MNTILLTGASGWLGKNIARNLPGAITPTRAECDLFSYDQTARIIRTVRPTHLIANAWIATPGIFWHDSINAEWLACTKFLIKTFYLSGGQRCVFISTPAAQDPTTLYGDCKHDVEEDLACYPNYAIARVHYLHGDGDKPERLIPRLQAGKPVDITNPDHILWLVDVKDAGEQIAELTLGNRQGIVDIKGTKRMTVGALIQKYSAYA